MGNKAFTLIELVVVIVLLSIVSVSAYVVLTPFRTQNIRAAAERIAFDIKYAKQRALSSNIWVGVSFQATPTNSYSIYETNGTTDTNISDPVNKSRQFTIALANDYKGISISGVNIAGGNKVEFNPYGVPYNDKTGSVLAADGVITLTGTGTSVTIRIAPQTGRIYIQ